MAREKIGGDENSPLFFFLYVQNEIERRIHLCFGSIWQSVL